MGEYGRSLVGNLQEGKGREVVGYGLSWYFTWRKDKDEWREQWSWWRE